MEAAIAFPMLLERMPQLELAVDVNDIAWNETLLLHGMRAMPIRF